MKLLDQTGLTYLWGKLKDKFVKKNGDTMTGTLTMQGNGAVFKTNVNYIDTTSPPSGQASLTGSGFVIADANGVEMGSIKAIQKPDGSTGISITAKGVGNASTYTGSLILTVASDGTRDVNFVPLDPWKSTLGITALEEDYAELAELLEYLTPRLSADGTFVSNSAYIGTTYQFKCYRRGLMGTVFLDFNKSATASGSDFVKIGTVPNGYRPINNFYNQVGIQSQNAHATIGITNDGDVNFYANHTTTGRCRCTFSYPLAKSQLDL